MTVQFEYSSIRDSQDEQQLNAIISQCFGSPPIEWETYFARLGRENFRLLRHHGEAVAGLALYQMGQWYGGQSVPMVGIAAVGVAPEYRGTGVAYELMRQTVQELHRLSVPISVLYAATQVLYRKVGYEQGGSFCRWELSPASIQLSAHSLPMHPINPVRYEVFQDIYSQKAQANNGNLARHRAIWERVVEAPEGQPIYAYLIGAETQPEGYVIFTQRRESEGFILTIRDWAVLTEKAARRFWSFLSAHRSQITQVRWQGAPFDSSLLLLPEQTAKLAQKDHWMLRVIDVPLALAKRGYPLGIETELHLDIKDDLLTANQGKFCLQVARGRGEVIQGGKGDFQIDIRGLASLYTGLFTPHQLLLSGHLQATQEALSIATLLFSSAPQPWMPDFF